MKIIKYKEGQRRTGIIGILVMIIIIIMIFWALKRMGII